MLKINKFIIVLFFSSQLFSQNMVDGIRVAESGVLSSALNSGLGGATISGNGGYSASLINPATLGLMKNSEVALSFYFNENKNNSTYFGNSIENSKTSNQLNELGFVYKVPTQRGSMAFSMGYSKTKDFNSITEFSGFNSGNNSLIQDLTSRNSDLVYDLRLSHPVYNGDTYLYDETYINGNLLQEGKIIEEGYLDNFSIGGAVEISKNLYVGASLNFVGGNYYNDRVYSEIDVNNVYGSNIQVDPDDPLTTDFIEFYSHDNYSWDISGFNIKGGFIYNFSKLMTVGGSIESSTSYTIKEDYFVEGSSYFQNDYGYDVLPQASYAEYSFSTPMKISIGGTMDVLFVDLLGSVDLIDYSEMEFTDGFDTPTLVEKNKEISENLGFAPTYRFGVSTRIPFFGVKARFGSIYMSSPFKDAEKSEDKKYYTFGLGFFPKDNFGLDLSTVWGTYTDFTDIYGNGEARIAQEKNEFNFLISMKYRF